MSHHNQTLINQLYRQAKLDSSAFTLLLSSADEKDRAYAAKLARQVATDSFGRNIYMRGLIEFTNHCKNNCFYCGLRRDHRGLKRYRLNEHEILNAAAVAHAAGCRTIVLQGGEDPALTVSWVANLIRSLKRNWPDTAITLSLGERSATDYKTWFAAGADRYLLREETASPELYNHLHPPEMTLANRLNCLAALKDIGYQTGAGFLVGSPSQTAEDLAADLIFIQSFQPAMIGIGPFLPQADTPFGREKPGDPELTLFLISLLRLMLTHGLIPATTAIGTALPDGYQRAILAGANVIMPNFTPLQVRKLYSLYDHKREAGDSASSTDELFREINYRTVIDRGDFPDHYDRH